MLEWNIGIGEDFILPDMGEMPMICEDTTQYMYAENRDDSQQLGDDTVSALALALLPTTIISEVDEMPGCDNGMDCEPCPENTLVAYLVPVYTHTPGRKHNATAVSVLKAHFDDNPRPNFFDKQRLVTETGISLGQVSMWFNNKRKRL